MFRVNAWIKKYHRPLSIGLGALVITAILLNLEFNLLEAQLYDLRMTKSFPPIRQSNMVLITLDEETEKQLNEFAPLSLDYHVKLLEKLSSYNVRAVGYLVDMTNVHQVDPDMFSGRWGERFVQLARSLNRAGTAFVLGTAFDVSGESIPPFPLNTLEHRVAAIYKDSTVFSEDQVTRRALTYMYDRPTFHLALAANAGFVPQNFKPRGSFSIPEVSGEYFFFRYHANTTWQSMARSGHHYRRVSFADVLNGSVSRDALEGKTILVGTLTRENPSDFIKTPYSKRAFSNPAIGVHANILESIIENDGLVVTPTWVNAALVLLTSAIILWAVVELTPLFSVFTTLGLTVAFLLAGYLLFQSYLGPRGIWVHESQPLVSIFLSFYLAVPYRLIREYKRRWEYQRHNEILVQVEEMKTNFLRLVTHDLKTPVARIQGLAEVLLKRSSHEELNTIVRSTDELNQFISGILELTKIQSNQIKIKPVSKDINQIIERSVERLGGLAQKKRIRIATDLEPMFPIRLDPELISKVVCNLIDNAIKYSPEGSEVRVTSREIGQSVEISVHDQGIGLNAEELEHLFTKFYRGKNETTTQVIGTGLGLYLTKYFVETHRGKVSVESQPGKGSVFRILLPDDAGMKARAHENQQNLVFPGLRLLNKLLKREGSTHV